MRIPARYLLAAVIVLSISATAWAQSATTSLRGTVFDEKGAVIPGASVTLSDAQTGFKRTIASDDHGDYQFLQLIPGNYAISVSVEGFATVAQENIQLLVNTPATLMFTLQVRGQATTVQVTEQAPLVNTVDSSIGNTFNTQQVLNLPFEGRNATEILSLQPGAIYLGRDAPNNVFDTRSGAVNGGRSDQSNITLDGVDDNDDVHGVQFTAAVRSTLDSIQEFRVTTAGANADQGRSSGGQIAMITREGTNTFHGSLYEYNRSIGHANDWFNKKSELDAGLPNKPPPLVRNTYGGSIGGPVIKNRLFFFGTYEGQHTAETDEVSRSVPGDTLRAGMISYPNANGTVTTLKTADIKTMDPNCTGLGTCPLGPGPNPAVIALFQNYPRANSTSCADADGFNIGCFTFAARSPSHLNTTVVKLDYNLNQSGTQHLFLRGNYQDDTTDLDPQFPGQPPSQVLRTLGRALAIGYTATLSNSFVNSFHYGYAGFDTSALGQQTSAQVQFRGIDNLIPLAGNLATNEGSLPTSITHVPTHNFVDDVTWTKGSHTFQFGTNIRIINNIRSSDFTSFNSALVNPLSLVSAPAGSGGSLDPGAFGFPDVDPNNQSVYNNAIIDLVGIVSQATANYNYDKNGNLLPQGADINRHFRGWEYEWYAQDAWRVTPNLTLTAGLRYSLLEPPYELNGVQAAPDINIHNYLEQRGIDQLQGQVFSSLPISFNLSGQANGGKPYWPYDYKNLAPRFAFAYAPSADSGFFHKFFGSAGKSSFRGGFGVVFDHFGEGIVDSFDQFGTFGLSTAITNAAGVQTVDEGARFSDLTTIPASSLDGPLLQPAPPGGFPATPPVSTPGNPFQQIAFGLDDKLRTPYSELIDLSFTRELPHGFVVEVNYVGRLGRRLLQQRDMAMPLDLVDPKSHTDLFAAETALSKDFYAGKDINTIGKIPYWENLFPSAAGVDVTSSFFGKCFQGATPANPTATQSMYELYSCNTGAATFGETEALNTLDTFCFPACANINGVDTPFTFFSPQYSALYAWSSVGNSSYNAGQFVLRSRQTHGLTFDFNYTWSHSIDEGSDAERSPTFGGLSSIINTWAPQQLRADSDFDVRNSINTNWVYELPFGKGRSFGGGWNGITDGFLGGWQVSGLARWTSGLPFSIGNGGVFPTNFDLSGDVFTNGVKPQTKRTYLADPSGSGIVPSVFPQGLTSGIVQDFRFAYPGESGQRNNFRGDGYFDIDLGLAKSFKIGEYQSLQLSAQAYNLTNSVRFDVEQLNTNIQNSATFGEYGAPALVRSRILEFAFRYSF
jgi:hypothetical protein